MWLSLFTARWLSTLRQLGELDSPISLKSFEIQSSWDENKYEINNGGLWDSNACFPVVSDAVLVASVMRIEQRPTIVHRFFRGTEFDLGILSANPRRIRRRQSEMELRFPIGRPVAGVVAVAGTQSDGLHQGSGTQPMRLIAKFSLKRSTETRLHQSESAHLCVHL